MVYETGEVSEEQTLNGPIAFILAIGFVKVDGRLYRELVVARSCID